MSKSISAVPLALAAAICGVAILAPGTTAAAGGTIITIAGGDGSSGDATSTTLYHPHGVAVDGDGDLYLADTENCRIRKISGGAITNVAGNGSCGYGDDGEATTTRLYRPSGLAASDSGDLYIADSNNCRVKKVSGATITTVAGTGLCDYGGDGGAATSAYLRYPSGVALDGIGDLYIADTLNCRVRKVNGTTITTFAGTGSCSYSGDGGAATSAGIDHPYGVVVGSSGEVYISDAYGCAVRKVSGGTITTVAGTGGSCAYGGDGGAATSANLNFPASLALQGGDLYIADTINCRVRKVSGGTITTVAGNGSCADSGDGGAAASASMNSPFGVATSSNGALYIADTNNCRVRKVSSAIITTVAGNGSCGYGGDGGGTTSSTLSPPNGVAIGDAGDIYIADTDNCRVRKVSEGIITTVAGNGSCGYSGDGGAATMAMLYWPRGVAVSDSGDLYIADSRNCRVRKVSGGTITTVAGNVSCAYYGDGGAATDAALSYPDGVAVDDAGVLYIADTASCHVRMVSGGTITTFAGNGSCQYSGDGGPAASAGISNATGVAVSTSGDLYIADYSNCRIRKVSGGTITTVAGGGPNQISPPCAYAGDGGAATSADLYFPVGVAVSGSGDLYISEPSTSCRVRKVSGGSIATFAGNGSCAYGGDGGPATSATLNSPSGVAVDASGRVYIADTANNRIRMVTTASVGGIAVPPELPSRTSSANAQGFAWKVAGAVVLALVVAAAGGWAVVGRHRIR
jgi:trimeric autotransporter adhesin